MTYIKSPIKVWIELARQIAMIAHTGQKRSNGKPYIVHPARVAQKVKSRLKPIAWLHDVCEDTPVTINDLEKDGFPQYIVDAVDVLTHRFGDTNMTYWNKILTNSDAVIVKINDIKDNLSDNPNEYQRIKYGKALDLFQKAGYSV